MPKGSLLADLVFMFRDKADAAFLLCSAPHDERC